MLSAMQNQGFFVALSEAPYPSDQWTELAAGLLTMGRVRDSLQGLPPLEPPFREARAAAIATRDIAVASMLLELLDAAIVTAVAPKEHQEILCRRLFAYGVALRRRGHVGASTDVFLLVSDHAGTDVELRLDAIRQLAYSFRTLNEYTEAERCYRWLCEDADRVGIDHMHLVGLLGIARCTCERGNFEHGSQLLNAVISCADATEDRDIQEQALVDRACVAGRLRDHEGAYQYASRALRSIADDEQRDRCLVVLAAACRETGRTHRAYVAANTVLSRNVAADVRAEATITLFELATDAGDHEEQQRHREWLDDATLVPLAAARFEYAKSVAAAARDSWSEAEACLSRYLAIVDANELYEERIRGDEAMRSIRRKEIPASYTAKTTSVLTPVVWDASMSGTHDVPGPASTTPVSIGIVPSRSGDV